MELWNDFEGKTVAGRFPLERLLGPQGRSAFFQTTNNGSGPAVIRLIETHFDEEEILGRWRTVMGLKDSNLQALTTCGDTTLDGTKLVYAVLEPTDMELADALRERPLTVAETRQVASAVLSALETLHAAGLVHEHVEPGYVLAQGEAVKLRSDSVREAPEEGAEAARAADVRGLALLIAECLTQARDESRAGTLPAPFAEMVRRGAAGEWSLAEMRSALEGPVLQRPGMPAAVAGPVAGPRPAGAARVTVTAPARSEAMAGVSQAKPVDGASPAPERPVQAEVAAQHTPASVAARVAATEEPRLGVAPGRIDTAAGRVHGVADADRVVMDPVEDESRRGGLWAGLGVAAVVLFGWLGWHVTHRTPASPAPVAVTAPAATAAAPVAGASGETAAPIPAAASGKRSAATPVRGKETSSPARSETAAAGHGSWRVVAFTYNREDQARHKAEQIDARHSALHAEAWSPSGRAPWLVSLGGWMDQREAEALVARARRDGLPRDTFARTYRR